MLKFFHKIRLLLKKKHSISVFTKSVKFYRFILQISELGQLKRKKNIYCTFTKESWTDNVDVFI